MKMARVTTTFLIALLAGACLLWNPPAAGQQPHKAGAKAPAPAASCGSCHKAEHKIWAAAAHARAGLALDAAQRKDASCMACTPPPAIPPAA